MFPSQVAPRPRVSGAHRRPAFALYLAYGLLTGAPLTLSCAPPPTITVAPPQNPNDYQLERLRRARASGPQAFAVPTPLSVDTSSREATRQFYLAVYGAATSVPAEWTGNTSTGNAGDTSAAFKAAVILRINSLRALAGVPAGITLNSTYSTKDQQAALMMSANNSLSHTPPSSWTYYTADGAEAASNSNLSLGNYGPSAITRGYLADPGSNNSAVGHRRWLLYPQTREMGTGDVLASSPYSSANATWVVDSYFGTTRPATRDPFVAWPAQGYAPAPLIFPRWSFSYAGANFANATVTMADGNGVAIPVTLEPLQANIGEPTLAWIYNNTDPAEATPLTVTSDQTYHVTVSNVVIGGTARSFSYDVIAFDPQRTGSDTVPVTVAGSANPAIGAANTYTATAPSFATSVQWRSLQFDTAVFPVLGAESGLDGATATTTGSYGGRSTGTVGAGTASYELATPTFDDQFLTLSDTFYASTSGTPNLSFLSRLGTATKDQTARVQVSTDEGTSWSDVYTQVGTNSNGESGFVTRNVSLAAFAGLTFRVRFAYTLTGSSYYFQTTNGVGWYFDNINLTGVKRVSSASTASAATGTSFSFTPASAGTYGLQARGVLFSSYPMAWGPVTVATATAGASAPAFTTQPASQSTSAGSNLTLTTAVTGSTSIQWQRNGSDLAGATNASLILTNLQPASTGLYTAIATNTAGSTTSTAAIVGVATGSKVIGAGEIVGEDIHHANGNIFDQVLLNGVAESITADYSLNQITRTSFIDLDKDIVQVEFSGPGTLSLVLTDSSGPAAPEYYNQATVYMKGHAGIIITGADERTNLSVFSVGRTTAVNQALFKDNVTYDGIADLAFIAISSTNGKFGGVRVANANFFATKGFTGIYAPGVAFSQVFIGNLTAFDAATPVLLFGSVSDARITGGDLLQDNGRPVQVSGLTQLKFTAGGDSHGHTLPAQHNRAVLQQDGQDVTAQIVVNPTP